MGSHTMQMRHYTHIVGSGTQATRLLRTQGAFSSNNLVTWKITQANADGMRRQSIYTYPKANFH